MASLNLSLGVMVVSAAGSLFLGAVLPDVRPIEVHSLTYTDGIIQQERTITADGDVFYAHWTADILDAETMESVCEGGGSWDYPVGYAVAKIPLADWVGDENCTPENLSPGTYIPRAVWLWGSDQTTQTGDPFTLE